MQIQKTLTFVSSLPINKSNNCAKVAKTGIFPSKLLQIPQTGEK